MKFLQILFFIWVVNISTLVSQQFNQIADAVIEKDTAKIIQLLQSGVNINTQHPQTGTTVLMIASSYYYYDGIVEFLIKNGTDVNLQDNEGKTALLWAASNSLPNAEILVANGAKVNLAANDGMTPFLQASLGVSSGKVPIEMCELLRENGANINASLTKKSVMGWTALHYAVINGDIELVSYLIQHGANVNKTSADGLTPLYLAGLNENQEIIQLLKNAGAKN
jgi:serine/threonine-protein phosphatase 6 regulatory ankyrin repeat subunit B